MNILFSPILRSYTAEVAISGQELFQSSLVVRMSLYVASLVHQPSFSSINDVIKSCIEFPQIRGRCLR